MASAHCVLSSFSPPSRKSVITIKTPVSLSSSPIPSKPTNRKNHLRLKLLKTLPNSNPSTPLTPQQTPLSPKGNPYFLQEEFNTTSSQNITEFAPKENDKQKVLDTVSTHKNDEFPDLIEEGREIEEVLQQVQVTAFPEAQGSLTIRSVVEVVLYIVGFFIIQTIITVWWVLRKENAENHGNLEKQAEVGVDKQAELGVEKKGFWLSKSNDVKPESLVYVNESELKEKIVEIRAMAKEAREIEAKKKGDSSDVIEFDEDVSASKPMVPAVKNVMQNEVDGKLSITEKELRALGEIVVTSRVNYLNASDESKDKKELDRLNAKVNDENLVFKKKPNFKGGFSSPSSTPKGFQSEKSSVNQNSRNSEDTDFKSSSDVNNGMNSSDSLNGSSTHEKGGKAHSSVENALDKTTLMSVVKMGGKDSVSKELSSTQETRRKSEKKQKASKATKETKFEKTKSRSGNAREGSDELFNPKAREGSDELFNPKGSSKPMTNSSNNNRRDERASIEDEPWWLKLPYALAILLHRSSEDKEPGGLYSLKMDDGSTSHIIAFEDQRDASNFCHILETFFDELGDLVADVIPLSIKELKDEMKASALKVIVVRKGQLKLYVGQPLADVEMILRSLI